VRAPFGSAHPDFGSSHAAPPTAAVARNSRLDGSRIDMARMIPKAGGTGEPIGSSSHPMKTISVLLVTAAALVACDSGGDAKKQEVAKADVAKKADAPAKDEGEAKGEEKSDWEKKLESRVLADSGLGVGGKLSAFDIVNCESGEEYCQVCRFGGSPKVMAVGSADDEAFKQDLKDLDAIAKKYEAQGVKAFAVVTDLVDGKATTPKDAEAAKAKAKALKDELGITIPVVVPALEEGGPNKIWDEYYNITASRTVMFADGSNEVKWSAVAADDFAKLNEAIVAVVGS
jgi:hypothetical protein